MQVKIKDYWGARDIILVQSDNDSELIAIGEVVGINATRWIHIKKKDLQKFVKQLK